MREAPAVREVRPDATAASWSARSRGKPSDIARRSPSADTTTVWDTPGVLSTKLVINQLRFCAAWLIGLTLTLLVVGITCVRPRGTSPQDPTAQVAQPAPHVLRGAGDLWAALLGLLRRALDQVGLGHAPGETGRSDPARLRVPELLGPLPALVVRRAPVLGGVPVGRLLRPLRHRPLPLLRRGRLIVSAAGGLPVLLPATTRETRLGQVVTGVRRGPRAVEAYVVLRLGGSARRRFRFGLCQGIERPLIRTLVRPVTLVGGTVLRSELVGVLLLPAVRRGVSGFRKGVLLRLLEAVARVRVVAALVAGLCVLLLLLLGVLLGRVRRLAVLLLGGVLLALPGAVLLVEGLVLAARLGLQRRTAFLTHQRTVDRVQLRGVRRRGLVAGVVEAELRRRAHRKGLRHRVERLRLLLLGHDRGD